MMSEKMRRILMWIWALLGIVLRSNGKKEKQA